LIVGVINDFITTLAVWQMEPYRKGVFLRKQNDFPHQLYINNYSKREIA